MAIDGPEDAIWTGQPTLNPRPQMDAKEMSAMSAKDKEIVEGMEKWKRIREQRRADMGLDAEGRKIGEDPKKEKKAETKAGIFATCAMCFNCCG